MTQQQYNQQLLLFGQWLMRRFVENNSRDKFDIHHIEDAALDMGLLDYDVKADRMVAVKIDNIFRAEDSLPREF
jgi:hypothetical protein